MDERELVIKRGEEFKISVKDKIERTDLFYNQYISAAKMLNDILSYSDQDHYDKDKSKWEYSDFENNIIAFCGERGEGKSSAMISFTKAVYEHDKQPDASIFDGLDRIKNAYFAEPIVIDPSMLDDVHNVLDIILATLYKKFQDHYKENNQSIDGYKRERLLDLFQKVYQCISLINNQTQMLDDEYDYEGNIGKLSKLGQSTALKKKLQELIQTYIEVMSRNKEKSEKSGWLLIAIDDLDLCNRYAYKVAEQIRKYLVIPNVVIVMALKVEQLQLCVQENNHKDYERMLHRGQDISEIQTEIINMSERYVAKLIPKSRRIYLPHIYMMQNVKLVYQDEKERASAERKEEKQETANTERVFFIEESLLDLIYQKTGMRFLPDKTGKNYFLPDNLRDTVNIAVLLRDMKDPEGKNQEEKNQIYHDNILRFFDYYERQWLFSNVSSSEYKRMQGLIHAKAQLHEKSAFLLRKRYELTEEKNLTVLAQFFAETNDNYFIAMGWLGTYRANVFAEEAKKYAYAFQVLYTIRLNEMLRSKKCKELVNFMGGYLWAGYFQNILPVVQTEQIDRSRFELSTVRAFNTIAQALYPDKGILLPEYQDKQHYATQISKNDTKRKEKIITWTLLGMLSNTWSRNNVYQLFYTYNSSKVVFANHSLLQYLHISIENYILSLCNPECVYEKLNMEYLGISKEDFEVVVEEILKSNAYVIEIYRRFVVNTDVSMELLDYCSKRKEIKEGGDKSELERSQAAVDVFFKNAKKFAKDYLDMESDDMGTLNLAYDDGKEKIQISLIYAHLLEAAVQERKPDVSTNLNEKKRNEMIKAFNDKLTTLAERVPELESVSKYLITKTAKNAEANMSSLASNIQRYYSLHRDEKISDTDVLELCDLYGNIMSIYWKNPQHIISEKLLGKYKLLRNRFDKVCQE